MSGAEIVERIKQAVDEGTHDDFFTTIQEKNLIRYGAELVLVPSDLVYITALDVDGFEFVKKCKKNGLRLFILSNWDPASFELVRKKFPELFAMFDESDIIIPAKIGFIKPQAHAFEYFTRNLQGDAAQLFFVDDSAANVAAAQQCGITSVRHHNWGQTEQELVGKGLRLQ